MFVLSLLLACKGGDAPVITPPDSATTGSSTAESPPLIYEVAETERWTLDDLTCDVHVVRTEADVPHIYAADRLDLARVQGFVQARDRYFIMDLTRRLGLGTVSELLGDAALETDLESRGLGMTSIAERLLEEMTDEHGEILDAYAAGVNAYVDAVVAGDLPPPSELEVAGPILGAEAPTDLMTTFDRRDLAGVLAVLLYELGFETGDVRRAESAALLTDLYVGAALEELRSAGLIDDLWLPVAPPRPVSSAEGWSTGRQRADPHADLHPALRTEETGRVRVPQGSLERLRRHLDRHDRRMGRDREAGFGSNAWAVTASASAGGAALLASDGHLPLSVPPLFYQIGLDTSALGGGDTHQLGLTIPGLPFLAVGTNGDVAWSQTQFFGDITDWYSEEIQLDAEGLPASSAWQGGTQPLVVVTESLEIADVPVLGSEGRTETITRWTTFDGRWITEIEGWSDAEPKAGQSVIMLLGSQIVPGDTDGDGVISAVSFDYAGFEATSLLRALDGFGHAGSVAELDEATQHLVAYSQNIVAADRHGSVLYTGYQGTPCREYLARDASGDWAEGADPSMLIDGSIYGGFEIPLDDEGRVAEGDPDPYRCAVPWDAWPRSIDPAQGYVLTANNDPGNISTDDSLTNDPYYIGGPWLEGYRADTIDQRLAAAIAEGSADGDGMAELQGDHFSPMGEQLVPVLLEAIAAGRAAGSGEGESGVAELYLADSARFDEVEARLIAWGDGGYPARSGVETFYHTPATGDAEHAVATTIFNTWLGYQVAGIFNDEGLPSIWRPTSGTGITRALTLLLDGRGANNPGGLASWNPDTQESAFFDTLGTDEIETSNEIALQALTDALDALEAEPDDGGGVGFGTADMDAWLWGLLHGAEFESVLADLLGDEYAAITDIFSITPDVLPLADDLTSDDPRADLKMFPRPGDNFAVDAANAGFSGRGFDYGSGPVFRMVIELSDDGVTGVNVLPGGQSGMIDSEHFADQAAMWLGNETVPLRFSQEDVVAGATGREVYTSGTSCE